MKILGLDLSLTSTGWASLLVDPPSCTCGAVRLAPGGSRDLPWRIERLSLISSACMEMARKHDLVVIEDSAPSRNFPGKEERMGLLWLLLYRLHRLETPIYPLLVRPSALKKFTTGKGNAKKDQMRLAVYKAWGAEAETDDEIDAIALAHFGAAYLDPSLCRNQAQREAVEKIRAPKVKKARKAA